MEDRALPSTYSAVLTGIVGISLLLSVTGCKLGHGFSASTDGSLFGIPVELGMNEPPKPRSGVSPSLPSRDDHLQASLVSDESDVPSPVPVSRPTAIQQVSYQAPLEKHENFHEKNIETAFSQLTSFPQLTKDTWVKNFKPIPGEWRWINSQIDDLLILPEDRRPDFAEILSTETHPIVRANSAIVLVHTKQENMDSVNVGDHLLNAIHDASLSIRIRCAALEAYASLDSTSAEDLSEIFDTYYEQVHGKGNINLGKPEMILELLCDLPDKMPLSHHPCYIKPLTSRNPKIRLAALMIWQDHGSGGQYPGDQCPTLPEAFAECYRDRSPEIRAASMLVLAQWQHPQTMHVLQVGLRDQAANVRGAAVHGLGLLNTEESLTLLKPMITNPVPAIRTEVVHALVSAGQWNDVFRMMDDQAFEVRRAVAESLTCSENEHGLTIAKKYMKDVSPDVQETMLRAVSHWNPQNSYPLYLEAMNSNISNSRKVAGELLAEQWSPAKEYQFDAEQEKRQKIIATLTTQLENELLLPHGKESSLTASTSHVQASSATLPPFSGEKTTQIKSLLDRYAKSSDPETTHQIEKQFTALGPELVPILEQLVFQEGIPIPESLLVTVLPAIDPVYSTLMKLDAQEISSRRGATTKLLEDAKYRMLPELVYSCLLLHTTYETDEIVQIRLWELVKMQTTNEHADKRPMFWRFAHTLAAHSLAQDSPELHRRACEYLKDHGTPDDVGLLVDELANPIPSVIRPALQAISRIGNREHAGLVRPLLNNPQILVVVDAATALHCWGEQIGTDTLERLAISGDRTTKLVIVQNIRRINDPSLISILIKMLDEPGTTRQKALDTLPRLAGTNVASPQELASLTPEERVNRWKAFRSRSVNQM